MTSATLRAAKDLLLKHGWCQGAYFNPHDEICAAQAIGNAAILFADRVEATQALRKAMRCVDPIWTDNIEEWNDAMHRTPEQVLQAFDLAIQRAEQAEQAATIARSISAVDPIGEDRSAVHAREIVNV